MGPDYGKAKLLEASGKVSAFLINEAHERWHAFPYVFT